MTNIVKLPTTGPRIEHPDQQELPLGGLPVEVTSKSPTELIGEYVQLRDDLAAAKKKWEEFKKENFDNRMEEIENGLLAALQLAGVDSMNGPQGTVYKNHKTSATVSDQATFRGFVVGRMLWDLVDWRANKTQVKAFLDRHKELPPGCNYSVRTTVGIRRPGAKAGENDE